MELPSQDAGDHPADHNEEGERKGGLGGPLTTDRVHSIPFGPVRSVRRTHPREHRRQERGRRAAVPRSTALPPALIYAEGYRAAPPTTKKLRSQPPQKSE